MFHFLRRVGGLEKSEFGKLGVATAFSETVRGGGRFEVVAIVRIRERETDSKRVEDWYDSRTSQTRRVLLE